MQRSCATFRTLWALTLCLLTQILCTGQATPHTTLTSESPLLRRRRIPQAAFCVSDALPVVSNPMLALREHPVSFEHGEVEGSRRALTQSRAVEVGLQPL